MRLPLRGGVGLALAAACLLPAPSAAEARSGRPRGDLTTVATIPATPGVRLTLYGRTAVTDARGRARLRVISPAHLTRRLKVADKKVAPGVEVKFSRWYRGKISLARHYQVTPRFVDLQGRPVPVERVSSITYKGSNGVRLTFQGGGPQWLQGTRIVPFGTQLVAKQLYYTIEKVNIEGANVVNRAQQRFVPAKEREFPVRVLFYAARFSVRDALLRFPIGFAIKLQSANGYTRSEPLGPRFELYVGSLPRGNYRVSVDAPGTSFTRPLILTRNQQVDLQVISYLDMVVVLLVAAAVALGLLSFRRPALFAGVARVQPLVSAQASSLRDVATRLRPLLSRSDWVLRHRGRAGPAGHRNGHVQSAALESGDEQALEPAEPDFEPWTGGEVATNDETDVTIYFRRAGPWNAGPHTGVSGDENGRGEIDSKRPARERVDHVWECPLCRMQKGTEAHTQLSSPICQLGHRPVAMEPKTVEVWREGES